VRLQNSLARRKHGNVSCSIAEDVPLLHEEHVWHLRKRGTLGLTAQLVRDRERHEVHAEREREILQISWLSVEPT
jgi:hypothetical protein